MAAEKGKTPGKAARRTTGSGPKSRSTRSGGKVADKAGATKSANVTRRSRSEQATSTDGEIRKAADLATEKVTHIKCNQSMFQLRAQRTNVVNGTQEHAPELVLDFGHRGFIVADDAVVDAVQQVLDGTWSDGTVGGVVFQRLARKAGLEIITHGLALPPIPTWDELSGDRVVPVAYEAGGLATIAQVRKAIRYEREAGERVPKRAVRERVLADLEAVEAVVRAKGTPSEGVAAQALPLTAGDQRDGYGINPTTVEL